MTFRTIEKDLIPILKKNKAARCDDMVLYAAYVYAKVNGLGLGADWLSRVFSDRRLRIRHNIAPYDSIGRIRRKLQEEHEELRATENEIAEKKRAEREYKKYARGEENAG